MEQTLHDIIQAYRADAAHTQSQQFLQDLNQLIGATSHHRLKGLAYKVLSLLQTRLSSEATNEEQRDQWSLQSTESSLLGDYYALIDEARAEAVDYESLPSRPAVKKNKLTASQQKKTKHQLELAQKALEAKDYSAAMEAYTSALIHHPNCLAAFKGRARIALATDNVTQFQENILRLVELDRTCALFLESQWHIQHHAFDLAQHCLDPIFFRLTLNESLEILHLLHKAKQLDITFDYAEHLLEKYPDCEAIYLLLETIAEESANEKNLELAAHCFRRLSTVDRPFTLLAGFSCGMIEAYCGSYVEALNHFARTKHHPRFHSLDPLTQQRTEFGLLLCATKLHQHEVAFASIMALFQQNIRWKEFLDHWIMTNCVAPHSDALVRIYFLNEPHPAFLSIVQPFVRHEEFTPDLTSLFMHMNETTLRGLDNSHFSWEKMSPDQLNRWRQVTPELSICGLLLLVMNPSGLGFFINTPCLHKKINLLSLNRQVMCSDGAIRSALDYLMSVPTGHQLIATEPLFYEIITTASFNRLMPTLGVSILGIFMATAHGKQLLIANQNVRDKITTDGLDLIFSGKALSLRYITPLCLLLNDPKLIDMLATDSALVSKISQEGFNRGYFDGKSIVSPLYLCAKNEQGRLLLTHNTTLRDKITLQGLIDAIGYAKQRQHQEAFVWLYRELKRPEYQALTLHHRLLDWQQPCPPAQQPVRNFSL